MKKGLKKSLLPKSKIGAKINHEQNLAYMISQPVQGPDGVFKAVREAINNSLDVHATKVSIRMGEFEGKQALIISDNGDGFNHKAIMSVMSYGFSSKEREDLSTSGANGTGVKHFLGLGKLDKTKLTILTVSEEIPECTRMDISFEYLVALANKKAKAEDHVQTVPLPNDWQKDISRKTGATIIAVGDGRKMKTPLQFIEELSGYVTPRALSYVSILKDNKWEKPKPADVRGNPFSFSYNTKELGDVVFELWYGGGGDGPTVCGPTNAIIPLTELWKNMAKDQRGRIAKVWKTTSGYIYIQRANYFRQHDGSFSDEFYETKTSEEFVQLLKLVSEELEKLSDMATDEKSSTEKKKFLDRIVSAAKELAKPEFISVASNGGDMPFSGMEGSDQDYYILPKQLNLWPGETQVITLHNHGTKMVDFYGSEWSISGSAATLQKAEKGTAVVKGEKEGKASIKVKGVFGEHTIFVNVDHVSSTPFIKGPAYIKPGDTYEYELKRHDKDDVYWELENNPTQIRLVPEMKNRKQVFIQVDHQCEDCTVVLRVFSLHNRKEIARKRINILEEGARKQLPALRIGKKDYILNIGNFYPNTIANIDYAFSDSPLPEIVVNPLHPRIRKLGNYQASEHILAAIANVAMIDQVSDGIIKPSEAQVIVEQFVSQVKGKVFEKVKE